MTVIGLDIGYNETKAANEGIGVSFPSVVGSADEATFVTENGDAPPLIIEHNDEYFFYGKHAVALSRISERREDRDWITSQEYLILAKAALAETVISYPGQHVTITTGLPVAYFKEDKATVASQLQQLERVTWREGDKSASYPIHVDKVFVVPQPFGTLFAEAFMPTGEVSEKGAKMLSEPYGVIDIGGHTTNILVANRGSDVARQSTSVTIGGWELVRALRTNLTATSMPRLNIRDHQLSEAIVSGGLLYFGEQVSIRKEVDVISQRICRAVVAQASQLWGSGSDLAGILISGGGAYLMGEQLKEHFAEHKNVRIVDNPQFANASGFYKYGQFLKAME